MRLTPFPQQRVRSIDIRLSGDREFLTRTSSSKTTSRRQAAGFILIQLNDIGGGERVAEP